ARYWNQDLDPERVQKVEKVLCRDEDFRKLVEKWRRDYKPPNQSNKYKSNEVAHEKRPVTPPVVALASVGKLSVFATTDSISEISRSVTKPIYDLEKSWILDSGATVHVCNDISKFNDYRPIKDNEEFLWAGDSQIQINGYGTIIIHLKSIKYTAGRPLTLKNVAFVPSLHTNVTSLRLLNAAGVHWDTELSILKFNGRHYADTPMMFNQWVLEYNPISPKECVYTTTTTITKQIDSQHHTKLHGNSSRSPRVQTRSFDDWHIRMGHLYPEALLKLPLVTKGCRMITSKPAQPVCDTCRISNAKRIVSRVPRLRATRPFWRISWDLIQMHESKNGEVYILHFVCDFTHMHFVYILPNKLQDTLLNTFISFVSYIKRRWGFEIVVWKGDGEKSLGSKWIIWINSHGYEVETSSPHTQEQNGDAERSGRMLQILGTKLKATFNLPDSLWTEIFPTAGYILNRSPTRSLGFKTPLGFLKEYLGESNPEPFIAHLQPYGCKAFSLIKNRPKLDKLTPRAEIGYLVGYVSTNIFRIWLPLKNMVISTRDVTFNPTEGYSPDEPAPIITDEVLRLLQVPQLEVDTLDEIMDIPEVQEEFEIKTANYPNKSDEIQENQNEIIQVKDFEEKVDHENQTYMTHDQNLSEKLPKGYVKAIEENDGMPTREIIGDPGDVRNIIHGKRQRKQRAQFHLEVHQNLDQLSAFHVAIQQGSKSSKLKLHKSQLPPPPENWYQLQYHPHREGFNAAAHLEFETLTKQETFKPVKEKEVKVKPIPVKWVFTYKTDDDGYLLKYKARMVIRGDLQIPTEKDTYAATLAMRVNRAILAICAYFDLETHQFDVTNAFPHANLDDDDEVVINYPEGFKVANHKLRVLKALYGLSISPRLWYNHLAATLEKIGLKPVPESGCVFCNDKLIVCFYVD
ncbi:hypothetical protein K3495_g14180, partial [Podosphaera aphanis]